jgi:hypothetical protein
MQGHFDVCATLVSLGADVTAKDGDLQDAFDRVPEHLKKVRETYDRWIALLGDHHWNDYSA